MGEHTLGSWHVQEYSDRFDIQTADAVIIAQIIRSGTNEQEWAEEFRNARILAASLDLLALAECVEWVSTPVGFDDYCPWCGNFKRQVKHKADCKRQGALHKANGGG